MGLHRLFIFLPEERQHIMSPSLSLFLNPPPADSIFFPQENCGECGEEAGPALDETQKSISCPSVEVTPAY